MFLTRYPLSTSVAYSRGQWCSDADTLQPPLLTGTLRQGLWIIGDWTGREHMHTHDGIWYVCEWTCV